MKPKPLPKTEGFVAVDLPLPKLGLDVLTPEGDLAEGAVRRAENVMLHDSGAFDRRPGYAALITLSGSHSLWQGSNGAYVAAAEKLYSFTPYGVTEVFSGLPTDDPVEYCEVGEDVYFTAGAVLRKMSGGLVRRPGVADVFGGSATVAATNGGMASGSYGAAYSLVNDLGEESGLSQISFVTGTGVEISGIPSADNVVTVNLYATGVNGEELFLAESVPWNSTAAVLDQRRYQPADKQYLVPMPGGEYVRAYRGRLYVSKDVWLYYSEPFTYGLTDVRSGYMTFGAAITLLEPVEGGIFVGFADRVIFLRGAGPEGFEVVNTVARGAVPHTGTTSPADRFTEGGTGTVALWLSPQGLAIGHADGSVALPQADRIQLTADAGRTAVMQYQGIRQVVFTLDHMTLGSASDSTSLNINTVGVGYAAGSASAVAVP